MSTPVRVMILLVLVGTSSGCEVGRAWGVMSSDSPMPFLGFDLLPRRRTTQLTPPPTDEPGRRAEPFQSGVKQVSQRLTVTGPRSKELRLPPVSQYFRGETEEDVSLTGPRPTFSR